MDFDIDKPSALAAVVVGLAASLLIDVSTGPREVGAQEVPSPPARAAASGPTTRAGCPTESVAMKPLPAPSPVPAGPTDRQVNSSGTGAGGAAGTIGVASNDPCERAKTLNPRTLGPRGGASAPAEANPARQP